MHEVLIITFPTTKGVYKLHGITSGMSSLQQYGTNPNFSAFVIFMDEA
jgi:hypothetical protein